MESDARAAPPPFARMAADPLRWRLLRELASSDRRVRELVLLAGQPQLPQVIGDQALRLAG